MGTKICLNQYLKSKQHSSYSDTKTIYHYFYLKTDQSETIFEMNVFATFLLASVVVFWLSEGKSAEARELTNDHDERGLGGDEKRELRTKNGFHGFSHTNTGVSGDVEEEEDVEERGIILKCVKCLFLMISFKCDPYEDCLDK